MPLLRANNPTGLRLNRSHPSAKSVQLLAVANGGGNMVDVSSGQTGTIVSGTVTGEKLPVIGTAANVNTSSTKISFTGRSTTETYDQGTIAALVQFSTITPAASRVLYDSTVTGWQLRISGAGNNQIGIRVAGTTNLLASNVWVTGGIYFVAGSFHKGSTPNGRALCYRRLDANGFEALNSSAVDPGTASPATGSISIGENSASTYFGGSVAFAFMSRTYTPLEQLVAWVNNPWSIFDPGSDWEALSSMVPAAIATGAFPPGAGLMPYFTR